jgi:hypothetical protein
LRTVVPVGYGWPSCVLREPEPGRVEVVASP